MKQTHQADPVPDMSAALVDAARDAADRRERILTAAESLFAESGFAATPTSRIAERARVPKGLVHYYFPHKQDLLTTLVRRIPDETVKAGAVATSGDLRGSLHRLISALDASQQSSLLLSHVLWREADTHPAVRLAVDRRFRLMVEQIRQVIDIAMPTGSYRAPVETAAALLAGVVSFRHATARHQDHDELDHEIEFVAGALERAL